MSLASPNVDDALRQENYEKYSKLFRKELGMTRELLVAQDKGGSCRTTIVRAVAEAIPGVEIVETDASHRLVEFDRGNKSDRTPCRFLPL